MLGVVVSTQTALVLSDAVRYYAGRLTSIRICIVEPHLHVAFIRVGGDKTKASKLERSDRCSGLCFMRNMWAFCWFKPEESIGLNACVFFHAYGV